MSPYFSFLDFFLPLELQKKEALSPRQRLRLKAVLFIFFVQFFALLSLVFLRLFVWQQSFVAQLPALVMIFLLLICLWAWRKTNDITPLFFLILVYSFVFFPLRITQTGGLHSPLLLTLTLVVLLAPVVIGKRAGAIAGIGCLIATLALSYWNRSYPLVQTLTTSPNIKLLLYLMLLCCGWISVLMIENGRRQMQAEYIAAAKDLENLYAEKTKAQELGLKISLDSEYNAKIALELSGLRDAFETYKKGDPSSLKNMLARADNIKKITQRMQKHV